MPRTAAHLQGRGGKKGAHIHLANREKKRGGGIGKLSPSLNQRKSRGTQQKKKKKRK